MLSRQETQRSTLRLRVIELAPQRQRLERRIHGSTDLTRQIALVSVPFIQHDAIARRDVVSKLQDGGVVSSGFAVCTDAGRAFGRMRSELMQRLLVARPQCMVHDAPDVRCALQGRIQNLSVALLSARRCLRIFDRTPRDSA